MAATTPNNIQDNGTAEGAMMDPAHPGVPLLSDGSSFFTASMPLPKDHWLHAPRNPGWDSERQCNPDLPYPILERDKAHQVAQAVKYALRAATNCGQDMDLDPDALVQNAVMALCGPAGTAQINAFDPRT